jgi:two-component system, cell cycle response regulator
MVIRAVVRGSLEDEGYRVIEAVDGLAALESCRQDPPDVLLLDIEMPQLDGYQVLSALKSDAELKDIPVVFLTSRSGVADVVTGLRGGAHDYLKKPFENIELIARIGSAVHVKKLQDQLRQRNADLDRMSRTDVLTGLYNRRHLDEELMRQHSHASRHHDPLCVLLLDIDHFKRVNDSYGHSAGDLVLRGFADRLRAELRVGDIVGRWGGEEFLVIMPRTTLTGGFDVAERLRAAIAAQPMAAGDVDIDVSVSGGCASGIGHSVDALLQIADSCLYRAKASGRNKIITDTVLPADIAASVGSAQQQPEPEQGRGEDVGRFGLAVVLDVPHDQGQ